MPKGEAGPFGDFRACPFRVYGLGFREKRTLNEALKALLKKATKEPEPLG